MAELVTGDGDLRPALAGALGTPDPGGRPGSPFATLLRLHLTYLWRHRRLLSLTDPRLFTEFIQRRKLVDRDARIPQLIDKLAVKWAVEDALGPEWVTPTLWLGDILPEALPCAPPFVVKSRHGCRQTRIIRTQDADWAAVRKAAATWMRRSYGGWLDEWGYRSVPRGLLIEPFVGTGPSLPIDYKLYVFHGRVEAIQVHLDREHNHRWILFNRSWRRLSTSTGLDDPEPPTALQTMIDGAEKLGAGFDFVRVDLYDAGAFPRFGEMTFYPGSGLDPFRPASLDQLLGSYWQTSVSLDSKSLKSVLRTRKSCQHATRSPMANI